VTRKKNENKKEKMIMDVNVILLVEKKKKSKLVVTTSKEITKVSLIQEGNPDEVAKASSILSEIRGKHVEIPSDIMAKPLVPIVKEVET
jgi:hypothetical protein